MLLSKTAIMRAMSTTVSKKALCTDKRLSLDLGDGTSARHYRHKVRFTQGVLRRLLTTFVVLISLVATAQTSEFDELPVDPLTVKPEVLISVEPVEGGLQKVTVTVFESGYPAQLLRQQVLGIGRETNKNVDVVQVVKTDLGTNTTLGLTRAVVITSGLIGPEAGQFNLNALVRPFLGAEAPNTIDSMLLMFVDQQAGPHTVQQISSGAVRLVGTQYQNPDSVEFRIVMLGQDPAQIDIVNMVDPAASNEPEQTSRLAFSPWLIPLGALVLVGAAALVYFGLFHRGSKRPEN